VAQLAHDSSDSKPAVRLRSSAPLRAPLFKPFGIFPHFTPTLQNWPNQAISGSIYVQNAYTFFPHKACRLFFQNMHTGLHTAFKSDFEHRSEKHLFLYFIQFEMGATHNFRNPLPERFHQVNLARVKI
jgi:hypothetical protein